MPVRARQRSPRTDLPPRARQILAFIESTQQSQGAPPTLREIGHRFGIRSTNGVHYHLELLAREGLIRRTRGRARGIALPKAGGAHAHADALADALAHAPGHAPALTPGAPRRSGSRPRPLERLPILGRIAAGGPLFAEENVEGHMDLESLMRARPEFALRVQGDSMRDAGILEGDVVMVKPDPDPRDGEIVVALIGDEATVKRFFRKRGGIVLQPENPAYEPIEVTPDSPTLRILGRVVGVYRELR
jgi:repressor LexA